VTVCEPFIRCKSSFSPSPSVHRRAAIHAQSTPSLSSSIFLFFVVYIVFFFLVCPGVYGECLFSLGRALRTAFQSGRLTRAPHSGFLPLFSLYWDRAYLSFPSFSRFPLFRNKTALVSPLLRLGRHGAALRRFFDPFWPPNEFSSLAPVPFHEGSVHYNQSFRRI